MDGVVDTVGGAALTKIFAQTKPGGIVAACGNAGGIKINTNVMFIFSNATGPAVLQQLRLRSYSFKFLGGFLSISLIQSK